MLKLCLRVLFRVFRISIPQDAYKPSPDFKLLSKGEKATKSDEKANGKNLFLRCSAKCHFSPDS